MVSISNGFSKMANYRHSIVSHFISIQKPEVNSSDIQVAQDFGCLVFRWLLYIKSMPNKNWTSPDFRSPECDLKSIG
jgi:hypothetical protein